MIISLIAALDEKGGIGKQGQIPWHLSTDLTRFKRLTMGHHIVMGRNTFQSIGKPLPGRDMIIVTRKKDLLIDGCQVVSSLEAAIDFARKHGESELFIIGGGEIFKLAIGIADKLYLTYVRAVVEADVFFPDFDDDEWCVVTTEVIAQGEKDEYASEFRILVRTLKGGLTKA